MRPVATFRGLASLSNEKWVSARPSMPRLWMQLLVCAIPSLCLAASPSIVQGLPPPVEPVHTVQLPIELATDNRFLRVSTAEGASKTKVDSMVQDDAGFMWFGTHFGLYRYDGYVFKLF